MPGVQKTEMLILKAWGRVFRLSSDTGADDLPGYQLPRYLSLIT